MLINLCSFVLHYVNQAFPLKRERFEFLGNGG